MIRFARSSTEKAQRLLPAPLHAYIDASPVLECLSPATLSIVCFRANPVGGEMAEEALDELNREVLARLFWQDPAFVSSAEVSGKFALGICIVNHNTTWDDVQEVLEVAERFGTEALGQL